VFACPDKFQSLLPIVMLNELHVAHPSTSTAKKTGGSLRGLCIVETHPHKLTSPRPV
jgi:hypothetical protein